MFDKYIQGDVLVVHAGKVYTLDYIYIDHPFHLYGSSWYKIHSPLSVIHRVIPPHIIPNKVGYEVPLRSCNRYIAFMHYKDACKLHIPKDAHSGEHGVTVVYAVVPVGKQRSRVVVKLYTPEGVLIAEQASNICFDIPGTPDISAPVIHGLVE